MLHSVHYILMMQQFQSTVYRMTEKCCNLSKSLNSNRSSKCSHEIAHRWIQSAFTSTNKRNGRQCGK